MSVPVPPLTRSAPAMPSNVSFPAPPVIALAPASPVRLSDCPEPVRFSIPVKVSPAASPPVLTPLVRLTVTALVEAA